MVKLKLVSEIFPRKGDGLVFRSEEWEEGYVLADEPVIHDGIAEFKVPFSVRPDAGVYITSRRELERKVRSILSDPDKRYNGLLTLSCSVEFSPAGEIFVAGTVKDMKGTWHRFEYTSRETASKAKTRPLTKEQIHEQLVKTGGTLFSFSDIRIVGEEGWFAPMSVLNALRREILQAAEDAIILSWHKNTKQVSQVSDTPSKLSINTNTVNNAQGKKPCLAVLVSSISELNAARENGADRVYLA